MIRKKLLFLGMLFLVACTGAKNAGIANSDAMTNDKSSDLYIAPVSDTNVFVGRTISITIYNVPLAKGKASEKVIVSSSNPKILEPMVGSCKVDSEKHNCVVDVKAQNDGSAYIIAKIPGSAQEAHSSPIIVTKTSALFIAVENNNIVVGDHTAVTVSVTQTTVIPKPLNVQVRSDSEILSLTGSDCKFFEQKSVCKFEVNATSVGSATITATVDGYGEVVSDPINIIGHSPENLKSLKISNDADYFNNNTLISTTQGFPSTTISISTPYAVTQDTTVHLVSADDHIIKLYQNYCTIKTGTNFCHLEAYPQDWGNTVLVAEADNYITAHSENLRVVPQDSVNLSWKVSAPSEETDITKVYASWSLVPAIACGADISCADISFIPKYQLNIYQNDEYLLNVNGICSGYDCKFELSNYSVGSADVTLKLLNPLFYKGVDVFQNDPTIKYHHTIHS